MISAYDCMQKVKKRDSKEPHFRWNVTQLSSGRDGFKHLVVKKHALCSN